MANLILASLLSTGNLKVFNEATRYQIWKSLKIISVEIGLDSSNSDEPISTAQLSESSTYIALLTEDIQSAKIIRPAHMRIVAMCNDISTLESILSIYADTTSTLSITSRSIITDSLALTDVEVVQLPESLSASRVTLELEQAIPPAVNSFNPAQSQDSSTFGVRIQTPPTVADTVGTLYSKVQSFIGSVV